MKHTANEFELGRSHRSDRPAFKLLFAAGSILAHQDWMRMKCGSGLALATGFAAVQSFVRLFK